MWIKELIPPLVWNAARALLRPHVEPVSVESWARLEDVPCDDHPVWASASASISDAWNTGTFRVLTSILLACRSDTAKVLDFGGSHGPYYHRFRPFMPHRSVQWTVQELPEVVSSAKGTDELSFVTETPDQVFDLTIISGSLQCSAKPTEFLAGLQSQFILLDRLPVSKTNTEDRAHIQRIGSGETPMWVFGSGFCPPNAWLSWEIPEENVFRDFVMKGWLIAKSR